MDAWVTGIAFLLIGLLASLLFYYRCIGLEKIGMGMNAAVSSAIYRKVH